MIQLLETIFLSDGYQKNLDHLINLIALIQESLKTALFTKKVVQKHE